MTAKVKRLFSIFCSIFGAIVLLASFVGYALAQAGPDQVRHRDSNGSYTDVTGQDFNEITSVIGNGEKAGLYASTTSGSYCISVRFEGTYNFDAVFPGNNSVDVEFGVPVGHTIDVTYTITSTTLNQSGFFDNLTNVAIVEIYDNSGAISGGEYTIDAIIQGTGAGPSVESYMQMYYGGNVNPDGNLSAWFSSDCSLDPQTTITEPPVIPPGLDFNSSCVVTSTVTSPYTVGQTISASILYNGSFEEIDPTTGLPLGWYLLFPEYSATPDRNYLGSEAYDGDYTTWFNGSDQIICSNVAFPTGATHLIVGGNYRSGPTYITTTIQTIVGGVNITSTDTTGAISWTPLISDSHSSGGGYFPVCFASSFPPSNPDVHIDGVWAIPVDGLTADAQIVCQGYTDELGTADPPDPVTPTTEIPPDPIPNPGGLPIPLPEGGGAGVTCYECPRPDSILDISLWIGYMVCILQNLFSCSLRIWFLNVVNGFYGFIDYFLIAVYWWASVLQYIVNWWGNLFSQIGVFISNWFVEFFNALEELPVWLINNLLQSDFVQYIWSRSRFLGAIISIGIISLSAIIELIVSFSQAFIQIVELIIDLIDAVINGWQAQEYTIKIIIDETEISTINPPDLSADGVNPAKVLWLLFSAIGVIDYLVGQYSMIEAVLTVGVGVMAFGIILWTLKFWDRILAN